MKLKFPKDNPVRRFRNLPPPVCSPSCPLLSPPWLDLSEPANIRLNHRMLPSCYMKHQHLYGAQSRLSSDEEAEAFWGSYAPSSLYRASHLIYLVQSIWFAQEHGLSLTRQKACLLVNTPACWCLVPSWDIGSIIWKTGNIGMRA